MILTGLTRDAMVFDVRVQLILAAGVIGALLLPGPAAGGQAAAPWVGVWRLNPSKSTPAPNSPYKRVTLTIEPMNNPADGLRVMYDMVGTRGGVTHLEWSGPFDNKDYPVEGVDYVMTNAYSPIDDHTYNIVIKRDGQLSGQVKVTVSPDGRTLTAVTTGKNAQGQDATTTVVYDRL